LKKKFSKSILKKILFLKLNTSSNYKNFIFFNKSSTIPQCFIKSILRIYKGNLFKSLTIDKFNTHLKLGLFVFTRKPHTFINKKKKNSNLIKR